MCAPGRPQGRWCPLEDANFFSRLSFAFCDPLIRLGYKQPLQADDLWDVPAEFEAERVCEELARQLTSTKDPAKWPQVSTCLLINAVLSHSRLGEEQVQVGQLHAFRQGVHVRGAICKLGCRMERSCQHCLAVSGSTRRLHVPSRVSMKLLPTFDAIHSG